MSCLINPRKKENRISLLLFSLILIKHPNKKNLITSQHNEKERNLAGSSLNKFKSLQYDFITHFQWNFHIIFGPLFSLFLFLNNAWIIVAS